MQTPTSKLYLCDHTIIVKYMIHNLLLNKMYV